MSCLANASYTKGVGSYTCACDGGFQATSATAAFDSNDFHCEDRREYDTHVAQYCAENTNCDEHVGSYTYTCFHAYSIVNDQGEVGDPLVGGTCHDLIECTTNNDDC